MHTSDVGNRRASALTKYFRIRLSTGTWNLAHVHYWVLPAGITWGLGQDFCHCYRLVGGNQPWEFHCICTSTAKLNALQNEWLADCLMALTLLSCSRSFSLPLRRISSRARLFMHDSSKVTYFLMFQVKSRGSVNIIVSSAFVQNIGCFC